MFVYSLVVCVFPGFRLSIIYTFIVLLSEKRLDMIFIFMTYCYLLAFVLYLCVALPEESNMTFEMVGDP